MRLGQTRAGHRHDDGVSSEDGPGTVIESRSGPFDNDTYDGGSGERVEAICLDLENQLLDATGLFIGRPRGIDEP